MKLLHKCPTCQKYIHIVCSIDNKLQGKDNCFYCSPSCAGRDTTSGSTRQDSLLEKSPATDERADDVNPITPESNHKPSGKDADADADARLESLSKAMKDPLTSDNLNHAQNLIEDLKQNMEEHANSVNADPPS